MPNEDVRGVELDDGTRCAHYGSDEDVVALRFGCCDTYYACFRCHEAIADHPPEPWPTARRAESSVRCGVCEFEMAGDVYMATAACPNCEASFNSGCVEHYHLYFEWDSATDRD